MNDVYAQAYGELRAARRFMKAGLVPEAERAMAECQRLLGEWKVEQPLEENADG